MPQTPTPNLLNLVQPTIRVSSTIYCLEVNNHYIKAEVFSSGKVSIRCAHPEGEYFKFDKSKPQLIKDIGLLIYHAGKLIDGGEE